MRQKASTPAAPILKDEANSLKAEAPNLNDEAKRLNAEAVLPQ